MYLHNKLLEFFEKNNLFVDISISHTGDLAGATALIYRGVVNEKLPA